MRIKTSKKGISISNYRYAIGIGLFGIWIDIERLGNINLGRVLSIIRYYNDRQGSRHAGGYAIHIW